jgi:hypothetical protein
MSKCVDVAGAIKIHNARAVSIGVIKALLVMPAHIASTGAFTGEREASRQIGEHEAFQFFMALLPGEEHGIIVKNAASAPPQL